MKTDAKHVVFAILLPAVLIAGLVICTWIYQSGAPEKTILSDELRFASAGYCLVNGESNGAVIGLGVGAEAFATDLAYHPLAAGASYTPKTVIAAVAVDESKETMVSPIWIVTIGLFALALIAFCVLGARKRIMKLRKENSEFIKEGTIDRLTGLFNKPGFEIEASKALSKLPKERACAVVAFEVVSFRTYNELYGYVAGDALLKTIAEIARKYKNSGDVVGRLYSDHFVWFIDDEDSEQIFSTLRNAIRATGNTDLPFFLCAGIYVIEDRGISVPEMIDKASIAKNTIKYSFGTGIKIYDDSMLECQLQDAVMVGSMMQGLQNGEFIEYYQPKYNTDTEAVVGAEALVRWKKPDGEIITPKRFIGLFERNGFIRKLDFYMFERVCSFLAEAKANNKTVLPVSVNFSRVHLHDFHFPERLLALTKKYGVDPKNLEIELTESAFVMEAKDIRAFVDKLHKYGFLVAIDDFGSGFSSLNMLKDFDVDTIKIDTKFLEGFERGGKVGTIVTAVIRLSKWLGNPVVAEGVETREQLDFLRTLGCEMIQGYYYSYPLPRDEYEKLLEQKSFIRKIEDKRSSVTLSSIDAVLGGDSLATSLLEGIPGGLGIYELSGDRLEAIRVNHTYYEMLGYPDTASFREDSLNVIKQVYPPDVDKLLDACNRAVKTRDMQKITAHRYKYGGELAHHDCLIKYIGGTQDKPLLCMTFVDATERLRIDREKELSKYCDALHGIFDEIFEFNYMADTLSLLSRDHVKCNEATRNLKDAEKYWIENLIHPDDRERIEDFIFLARADEIKLPLSSDYRIIRNGEIRWISASVVSIAGGSYLLCKLDVTQKKQLEILFENMENLRNSTQQSIIADVFNSYAAGKLTKEKLNGGEYIDPTAL